MTTIAIGGNNKPISDKESLLLRESTGFTLTAIIRDNFTAVDIESVSTSVVLQSISKIAEKLEEYRTTNSTYYAVMKENIETIMESGFKVDDLGETVYRTIRVENPDYAQEYNLYIQQLQTSHNNFFNIRTPYGIGNGFSSIARYPSNFYTKAKLVPPQRWINKTEVLDGDISDTLKTLTKLAQHDIEPLKMFTNMLSDVEGYSLGNHVALLQDLSKVTDSDDKEFAADFMDTIISQSTSTLLKYANLKYTVEPLFDRLEDNGYLIQLKQLIELTGLEIRPNAYQEIISDIITDALADKDFDTIEETLDGYLGDRDEFISEKIIKEYGASSNETKQDLVDFVMQKYGYEYSDDIESILLNALIRENEGVFENIYNNLTDADKKGFNEVLQARIDGDASRFDNFHVMEEGDTATLMTWELESDLDLILGTSGDDTISAFADAGELIRNEDGVITGVEWNEVQKPIFIFGGDGNDAIHGHWVSDNILYGGDGDDILQAGQGDDIMYGGNGSDKLYSSGGADTFLFKKGDTGVDTISGYDSSEDTIDVSDFLESYDATQHALDDFVMVSQRKYFENMPEDSIWSKVMITDIAVDSSGSGENFTQIATFTGWNPGGVDEIMNSLTT